MSTANLTLLLQRMESFAVLRTLAAAVAAGEQEIAATVQVEIDRRGLSIQHI